MTPPFLSSAPSPHVGLVVGGDFRIAAPLSSGGMGEVWIAEQQSTGKRRALKLMRAELLGDASLLSRFEQEAKVASRIASEHVVEVVAAGYDVNLRAPFLAMELLEGESLDQLIRRRGTLAHSEVLEILDQLGHGLGAAHRAGIVHRDLKPENLFMANARQQGVAFKLKILDFGIAKLTSEARSQTQSSQSLGSPRWMAPEQAGMARPISPATDVWAVGLIVFSLLTGRYYWKHAAGTTESVMTLMREILFEPIVPASERAREFGVGGLPPGFDAWFSRCVAREPNERFQSGTEAIEAYRTMIGQAVSSTLSVPIAVPGPPSKKSTGIILGVVAFVFLALGVGGFLWWRHADDLARKKDKRDQRARVEREADESEDETDEETDAREKRPKTPNTADPTSQPTAIGEVLGAYGIESAASPDGSAYTGSARIDKLGDAVRVVWRVGSQTIEGVGLASDGRLGVAYLATHAKYSLGMYKVEGGELRGRTASGADGAIHEQTLTGPASLEGTFTIARSTDGASGTIHLTRRNELYIAKVELQSGTAMGVGMLHDGYFTLCVTPATSSAPGVVLYRIDGSRLVGAWMTGLPQKGRETLLKKP